MQQNCALDGRSGRGETESTRHRPGGRKYCGPSLRFYQLDGSSVGRIGGGVCGSGVRGRRGGGGRRIRRIKPGKPRIKRSHLKGHLVSGRSDATGCALTISTLSSHGFSLTRPPKGSAAIWSNLFQSSAGAEVASEAMRVTVPFSVMLLPRWACNKALRLGARDCRALMKRPAVSNFCAYGEAFSISTAFLSAAVSSSGMCLKPRF